MKFQTVVIVTQMQQCVMEVVKCTMEITISPHVLHVKMSIVFGAKRIIKDVEYVPVVMGHLVEYV